MPDPKGPPTHTSAKLGGEGLSFDDVLLAPRYSDVHPTQCDLRTVVARGIELNIPITSSAMDTVNEARLCVALAIASLSSDDDFETITVKENHVLAMVDFLEQVYSAENCRLDRCSKQ